MLMVSLSYKPEMEPCSNIIEQDDEEEEEARYERERERERER